METREIFGLVCAVVLFILALWIVGRGRPKELHSKLTLLGSVPKFK